MSRHLERLNAEVAKAKAPSYKAKEVERSVPIDKVKLKDIMGSHRMSITELHTLSKVSMKVINDALVGKSIYKSQAKKIVEVFSLNLVDIVK